MTASPTLEAAAELTAEARLTAVSQLARDQAARAAAVIEATGALVRDVWVTTGHLSTDWAGQYATLVSGAQRALYDDALAGFYAHAELATGSALTRVAPSIERAPWLVTAEHAHAKAATAQLAKRLEAGVPWEKAVGDVGAVLRGEAAKDLQGAMRQAGDNLTDGETPGLRGWRKVLGAGACGWCQVVADKRYYRAETVSMHAFDRCGVAPWMEGEPWTKTYEGDYRDVQPRPAVPSDLLDQTPPVLDTRSSSGEILV